DSHINASQLRDNVAIDSVTSLRLEELKGVKEALVSKENIADDTLGDEEWSAISASRLPTLKNARGEKSWSSPLIVNLSQ
ncbi:unnamed protein product, partial [Lymnaea stagnalis]